MQAAVVLTFYEPVAQQIRTKDPNRMEEEGAGAEWKTPGDGLEDSGNSIEREI